MQRIILTTLFLAVWPATASAVSFVDWFLTPDQQGRMYFEQGDYARSAQRFETRLWKAIAYYKAGDFASAVAIFGKLGTAEGAFYLANCYARQEQLGQAIAAYQRALDLRPDFPEAQFNLEWVKGLKKLDDKEYEDDGGTGGQLEADRIVFDERGAKGQGEMSTTELQARTGLSDSELQDMWMRRVQTTPGDFLQFKFAYQLHKPGNGEAANKDAAQ